MYFAGVDIGSTMTKVVIMGEDEHFLTSLEVYTGPEHRKLANEVMQQALEQANISFDEVSYIVATGYGRMNVPFADRQITELSCHAKGISYVFPDVKTAIDIGGQDIKVMKIADGKMVNLVMNDKCAAGTGRFLEVLADTLGLKVDELGSISLRAANKVKINNTCTVFAQQEVVAQLSAGEQLENIIAGVHEAMAERIVRLAKRLKIEPPVGLTGGGARNIGMVKAMEEKIGGPVLVPENPLLAGAIGAALLAKETVAKARGKGEPLKIKERHLEEVTFFSKE